MQHVSAFACGELNTLVVTESVTTANAIATTAINLFIVFVLERRCVDSCCYPASRNRRSAQSHTRGFAQRSECMTDDAHHAFLAERLVFSMNPDRVLNEIIPYRMQAVDTLILATHLVARWPHPPPLEIHVNGKLQVEGNLYAFTNPAIEVGLVHCRALLEFLGLTANKSGRIVTIERRRSSDVGIERFSNASGHLSMVNP